MIYMIKKNLKDMQMSSYGDIEVIRELLDLDEGTETRKLIQFKKLSNVWINAYVHTDILTDISTDVKDIVANYHTVYLFRMSSERFSGGEADFATQWKDLGKEIIDREILGDAEVYVATKVNK